MSQLDDLKTRVAQLERERWEKQLWWRIVGTFGWGLLGVGACSWWWEHGFKAVYLVMIGLAILFVLTYGSGLWFQLKEKRSERPSS